MAHDAAEGDARQVAGGPGDGNACLRAADSGASHRRIDLDEDADLNAVSGGGVGNGPDVFYAVDAQLDVAVPCEGAHAVELVVGDDLVGDENIGNAALHHDLGLCHLGGADAAVGASDVHLHLGEEGALDVLGVLAHLANGVAVGIRNDAVVAFERVQLDDEAGRFQLIEGCAAFAGGAVHLVLRRVLACPSLNCSRV